MSYLLFSNSPPITLFFLSNKKPLFSPQIEGEFISPNTLGPPKRHCAPSVEHTRRRRASTTSIVVKHTPAAARSARCLIAAMARSLHHGCRHHHRLGLCAYAPQLAVLLSPWPWLPSPSVRTIMAWSAHISAPPQPWSQPMLKVEVLEPTTLEVEVPHRS